MYAWEKIAANKPNLHVRDLVVLNPEWSAFAYLTANFGDMFPRLIDSIDGDLVQFKMGKMTIEFASQTLAKSKDQPRKRNHK